jgi:hypothetical protein
VYETLGMSNIQQRSKQRQAKPMNTQINAIAELLRPATMRSGPPATVSGVPILKRPTVLWETAVERSVKYLKMLRKSKGKVFTPDIVRGLCNRVFAADPAALSESFEKFRKRGRARPAPRGLCRGRGERRGPFVSTCASYLTIPAGVGRKPAAVR